MTKLIDLRERSNHPLEFRYSEIYCSALVSAPVSHVRVQPGFLLTSGPFAIAARLGAEQNHPDDAYNSIRDVLSEFYCHVQPDSAAEWIGLPRKSELRSLPPWAAVFPWRARSANSYRRAFEDAALNENAADGLSGGVSAGWLFCGPATEEKINVESRRLLRLIQSIRDNGYRRSDESDGDIVATALVNDDSEWRLLVTHGNHRAAVLAALDYSTIDIRVNLVVSRCDHRFWRNVVAGFYSDSEAQAVFDAYFEGRVPSVAQLWMAR